MDLPTHPILLLKPRPLGEDTKKPRKFASRTTLITTNKFVVFRVALKALFVVLRVLVQRTRPNSSTFVLPLEYIYSVVEF